MTHSILLAIPFLWLAAMNWYGLFLREPDPGFTTSWIPLLGGACGVVALLSAPWKSWNDLWWLALFLDSGSVPGRISTAFIP